MRGEARAGSSTAAPSACAVPPPAPLYSPSLPPSDAGQGPVLAQGSRAGRLLLRRWHHLPAPARQLFIAGETLRPGSAAHPAGPLTIPGSGPGQLRVGATRREVARADGPGRGFRFGAAQRTSPRAGSRPRARSGWARPGLRARASPPAARAPVRAPPVPAPARRRPGPPGRPPDAVQGAVPGAWGRHGPAAGRLPPQRRPGNHCPRASCRAWRGPGAEAGGGRPGEARVKAPDGEPAG